MDASERILKHAFSTFEKYKKGEKRPSPSEIAFLRNARTQVYTQAGVFGAAGMFLGYGVANRLPALTRFRVPVAAFGGVMMGLMQATATSNRMIQNSCFCTNRPCS